MRKTKKHRIKENRRRRKEERLQKKLDRKNINEKENDTVQKP